MKTHVQDTFLFILTMAVAFQLVVAAAGCRSTILLSTALPNEFQYFTMLIF